MARLIEVIDVIVVVVVVVVVVVFGTVVVVSAEAAAEATVIGTKVVDIGNAVAVVANKFVTFVLPDAKLFKSFISFSILLLYISVPNFIFINFSFSLLVVFSFYFSFLVLF